MEVKWKKRKSKYKSKEEPGGQIRNEFVNNILNNYEYNSGIVCT